MARNSKTNKSSGKSSSSFGKRTDAENSFHRAKKRSGRGEFDSEARPSRSSRSSDSDKPREFKPRTPGFSNYRSKPDGESRGGFSKKPYGRKEDESGDRPKRFTRSSSGEGRGFSRSEGGEKRPYSRRGESSSDERPRRFSKPDGERGGFRDKKPYGKRDDAAGEDKPKRFSKSFSRNEGDKKPYKKASEKKSFVQSRADNQRNQIAGNSIEKKSGDELIRLNKFISNSGVCSRREADELIKMGLVTVNGETITEMGHKVKSTDEIRYEGKKLKAEKPVYVLLNKPKGFITTTDDPQDRNTVMSLVASACKERIYPVGRLDRNTTGLLLLTNDGDLTDKLTHPSYNAKKIYKVELDKPITKNDFQKVIDGVQLEEGKALVDDAAIVSDDEKTIGIEIHIGWNRVVRRIFETLGYEVVKLDRVVYAGLDKKDLKRGQWRFLRADEIVMLKHFK